MSTYKQYYSDNEPILVEISPGGDDRISPGSNLSGSMGVIKDIAIISSQEINAMSPNHKPQEFEITFGIKAVNGQERFAVTQGTDEANFHVKIKWAEGGTGDLTSMVPTS